MPRTLIVGGREEDVGAVWKFVRAGNRCPYDDFIKGCEAAMRRKFLGSFDAATKISNFENPYRFHPLKGKGKPLWEFKEHDHRLYCRRTAAGAMVEIVLLNGWVKDKEHGKEEARKIATALALLAEYTAEQGG